MCSEESSPVEKRSEKRAENRHDRSSDRKRTTHSRDKSSQSKSHRDRPTRERPSHNRSSDKRESGKRTPGRPLRPREEPRRVRKFSDPEIPEGITGEELEKRERYQLSGLAAENAVTVAKHLVALSQFLEIDPERAYWHGQSASFRAGRLALVRERAGIAALKSGRFDVAQKELKAALRISGNQAILPYLAETERSLGNPRKALETIGKVDLSKLKDAEEVELRIVSAACRLDLGQADAAVVTLTCKQLNNKEAAWSPRLHEAYEAALKAAGR